MGESNHQDTILKDQIDKYQSIFYNFFDGVLEKLFLLH
jgi:hypothetical protein